MNIKIKLPRIKETKEINLTIGSTVQDALEKICIKPDTVIVLHDNKPIPIDVQLEDGQEITILQVSSGG